MLGLIDRRGQLVAGPMNMEEGHQVWMDEEDPSPDPLRDPRRSGPQVHHGTGARYGVRSPQKKPKKCSSRIFGDQSSDQEAQATNVQTCEQL